MSDKNKKNIMDVFNYINTSVDGAQNNRDLMNKFAQGVCQFTNATSAVFVKENGGLSGASNLSPKLKFSGSSDDSDSNNHDTWFISKEIYGQIKSIKEPKSNIEISGLEKYNSAVLPTKNGSLLLFKDKEDGEFSNDDMQHASVFASSASTVQKQDVFRAAASAEYLVEQANKVLKSLSFTEIDVIAEVFASLDNGEGLVIASKIADKNGYARSVTVNALRKLESAGVIRTRSLGVKGTYIEVLNKQLCSEINKFKRKGKR